MIKFKSICLSMQRVFTKNTFLLLPFMLFFIFLFLSCNVSYKFNQVSIPITIKTVYVRFIENKARYINPQLSPQLTDKLRQKIVSQTRLTQVNNENADYDISGYVSQYDVSTSGVTAGGSTGQQASTNRLTVGVTLTLLDRKTENAEPKNISISRSFDFSANLTLPQAETRLNEEIVRNLTDEIFNRIFSDW